MKPVVLLISGKAGTGKSTAAQYLHSLSPKSVIYHFAEGVKFTARQSFGWDGVKDEKGRILLQQVGQTGRAYNPTIWIDQCAQRIVTFQNDAYFSGGLSLVDDFRFKNEVARLKEYKQWLVMTLHLNAPDREILKGTPAYNEISETELDDWKPKDYDFYIDNSGTQEQLEAALREVVDKIKVRSR